MSIQDRQSAFSGTKEVDERLAFDVSSLTEYLRVHLDGIDADITVKQFKGGQSNPTYLVESSSAQFVLRRKPPGKLLKSAHAVEREYRVLSALFRTPVPTPRTYLLCEDETVIGTAFYVMEFVKGRTFWEPLLPQVAKADRRQVYFNACSALASLHQVEPERVGLADFGKPGNYIERQVSRWTKQYIASEVEHLPAAHALMSWLPERIPEQTSSTIVHGDPRLDNMIFHEDRLEVAAMLDWELATLGDPLADLGYLLMPWYLPNLGMFPGIGDDNLDNLGIPGPDEMAEHYCKQTGRPPLGNISFYIVYNMYRIVCILQGIAGRVRDGTATSPHAAHYGALVPPFAERAWDLAQTLD